MDRTINGMSLGDFFEKMNASVEVQKKDDGATYIGIDSVEKRIGELILPSNYNFTCSEPKREQIGNRQAFIVTGLLELLDDEGNIICRRCVPGGSEISFLKDSQDRPANEIKSYVASAKSNAFVNAWISIGLGGKQDLKFKASKSASKGSDGVLKEVVFTSNCTYSEKSNLLKANATVDGEIVAFRIFKEGFQYYMDFYKKSLQDVVKCIVDNYGSGKGRRSLKCYGTFSEYNGVKQFIFQKGDK